MQVTIHEAKTHLSRFIRKAMDGEDVVITRRGRPMVKLEALHEKKTKLRFGRLKGLVLSMGENFDDELEEFANYGPAYTTTVREDPDSASRSPNNR
jgi:antitoxin (DNA-binding transcriptional repressor) of toxin-antitoxin stability system